MNPESKINENTNINPVKKTNTIMYILISILICICIVAFNKVITYLFYIIKIIMISKLIKNLYFFIEKL